MIIRIVLSDWLKLQRIVNNKNYTRIIRESKSGNIVYNKNKRTVNIGVCGWCERKYVKTANKQKYCSDYCRDSARAHQSRVKSHRWYHKHKHELSEKQRWGLGSGVIGAHRHEDFDKEANVVSKELSRLGIKKWRK